MTNNYSNEEIFDEIERYLNSWQDRLLEHQQCLHDIEQRYMSKELLSETEKEIRKWCNKFQSIRTDLQPFIKPHGSPMDQQFKKYLYDLLKLEDSRKKLKVDWLNGLFIQKLKKRER